MQTPYINIVNGERKKKNHSRYIKAINSETVFHVAKDVTGSSKLSFFFFQISVCTRRGEKKKRFGVRVCRSPSYRQTKKKNPSHRRIVLFCR